MSEQHKEGATNSIDEQLLDEMRSKVLKKANDNMEKEKDLYDARDLLQVKENKWFLKRFLLDKNNNLKAATDALDVCLRWRKQYGVNDLKPEQTPIEFHDMGVVTLGKDKDGRDVIYGRFGLNKIYAELQASIMKGVTLTIETLDIESNGRGFAMVIDMNDVGISNFDIAQVRSLLTTLFDYYPLSVAWICIFEPSLFAKTLIAMVKTVVPSKYQKLLITCDRKAAADLIGEEFMPTFMGGKFKTGTDKLKPSKMISFQELANSIGMTESRQLSFLRHFEKNMAIQANDGVEQVEKL